MSYDPVGSHSNNFAVKYIPVLHDGFQDVGSELQLFRSNTGPEQHHKGNGCFFFTVAHILTHKCRTCQQNISGLEIYR